MKLLTFILLVILSTTLLTNCSAFNDTPIKIGILHSMTGTMAISEQSVIDATIMAIDEINASGGLLGKTLEAVVIDGQSDWPSFSAGAERLIEEEQVSVIFGCWSSASRKMVKPVVEKYDHLLFYPVQYEGLEASPNVFYTGATPNQQIMPAVKWSVDTLGKRIFLVASDYLFSHTANTLIKKQINALDAEIVGEAYLPLASKSVANIIDSIAKSGADVVLNTINGNGNGNIAFFKQLSIKQIKTPVMSFSLTEDELQHMDIKTIVGHYAALNYFQSLKSIENQRFVTDFKQKYGDERTTNASMAAAYTGVHLWAKAVSDAKTIDPSVIREALKGQSFHAPEGKVIISSINNHLWKPLYIGQIQRDGQFKIVWRESDPIRPLPYPAYRAKQAWHKFLDQLYQGWGERWAAPAVERVSEALKS